MNKTISISAPKPELQIESFLAEQVNLGNWMSPPYNRWSFNHMDAIVPTDTIHATSELTPSGDESSDELEGFTFPSQGKNFTMAEWFDSMHADAILITQRGQTIYENYRAGQSPDVPHICMSVSKSILGLTAGAVVQDFGLNLNRLVTDVLPELKATVFDGASIRQALDMCIDLPYQEDYYAQEGPIAAYRKASHWVPPPVEGEPSTLMEFFATLTQKSNISNGNVFNYASPVSDLLGCIVERVTGQSYAGLLRDLFWSTGLARSNAYITVDRAGAPRAAGGLCATPRDLERIASLFFSSGTWQGHEVIPASWMDDILSHGDAQAWRRGNLYAAFGKRDMHYRNQWYVEYGNEPIVMAAGIFGQRIIIDLKRHLIVVLMASRPTPTDPDASLLTYAAFEALRRQLP